MLPSTFLPLNLSHLQHKDYKKIVMLITGKLLDCENQKFLSTVWQQQQQLDAEANRGLNCFTLCSIPQYTSLDPSKEPQ